MIALSDPRVRIHTKLTHRGYDTYTPHRSVVYHDYNHNANTAAARSVLSMCMLYVYGCLIVRVVQPVYVVYIWMLTCPSPST
jgi:hypothetical protein